MFNSTFRQLEVFVSVVETGSFAKAALELGISQPGISRHVQALEDQSGGTLLERAPGKRSALTPLGEVLYAHAPGLVREAQTLGQKLSRLRDNQRVQQVRVTGHPYVMENIVRPILGEFLSAYPRAAINIKEMSPDVLERRNGMKGADIAFIMTRETGAPDVELLGEIPCKLVVHATHALAGEVTLDSARLGTFSFILPLPGNSFEREVLKVLHGVGCEDIRPAARAQFVSTMKDLVLRKKGIGYLPVQLIATELSAGELVALPVAVPPFYLGVILAGGKPVSNTAGALVDFVRNNVRSAPQG